MKRKIILSLAISAAVLSACNSGSIPDTSAEEGSENYTTGSYQLQFYGSVAERGSEGTEASEAGNAGTEDSEARAAFLNFLSGDVSLLENQESAREWTDIYFPNSELEYVFMDLDGDGVSELVLQYVDEPGILNAVFHYDNGKLICWDLDSVEMSSRNYPLRDGTMVHKYDYSGTQSYIVFRYLPDGSHEELFSLFARNELIYEDDSVPVPYYEVDGNETDRRTFDDELYMRISSQVLKRSAWKPVEASGNGTASSEGSGEFPAGTASAPMDIMQHFLEIDGLGLYNELAYNHCFVNGNILCTAYEIVTDEHPRTALNFYDLEEEVLKKTLYLQDGWKFEEFIGGSEDVLCKLKVSHYKSNNGAVFPVDSVMTVMNDYSKEISDYTYQNASINRGGHNISQWYLDIIDTDRDMKLVEGRDSGGDGWDPEYRYQRYMFPIDGNRFVYRSGGYEWMPSFGIYDFGTDTANDVPDSQDLFPIGGVHDGKIYSVKTAWDGYGGTELYTTDIDTLETSLFLTFPTQHEYNEYVNYFMSQNGNSIIAVKEYESAVTIYSIDPDSAEITMLFELPEYLYFNNVVFFSEDSLALKVIVNRDDKILMADLSK